MPIYEQSRIAIGKIKKYTGFWQCNFYSNIMLCCWDILLVLKSQLFRQNWLKLGSFLSINLQKKRKLKFPKKVALGKRRSTT